MYYTDTDAGRRPDAKQLPSKKGAATRAYGGGGAERVGWKLDVKHVGHTLERNAIDIIVAHQRASIWMMKIDGASMRVNAVTRVTGLMIASLSLFFFVNTKNNSVKCRGGDAYYVISTSSYLPELDAIFTRSLACTVS